MKAEDAIRLTVEKVRFIGGAYSTEDTYSHWVGRYFGWMKRRRKAGKLPDDHFSRIEGFLEALSKYKGGVSKTTQNQTFHALKFFYHRVLKEEIAGIDRLRAKAPKHRRRCPSRDEVARVLGAVKDTRNYPHRLILTTIYACGLRVGEPLALRIRDIDLEQRRLTIRGAKGGKDREVILSERLVPGVAAQMRAARCVWERSKAEGVPVQLPKQLGRKYPKARFSWQWFWLLPAVDPCIDRRTGATVWWHIHPSAVQKVMAKAAQKVGLEASVTPHHLRHAWASHAEQAGASPKDMQAQLGHAHLDTTMDYIHEEIARLPDVLSTLTPAHAEPVIHFPGSVGEQERKGA